MVTRKSVVVIGCRPCKEKARSIGHTLLTSPKKLSDPSQAFPAETAFNEEDIGKFFDGYTCPFCNTATKPTPLLMKMITRFINGPSHIVTFGENDVEIYANEGKIAYRLNIPPDSPEHDRRTKGMPDLLKLCFKNVKEDRYLLLSALQELDRKQWYLRIESKNNPIPFLRDEALYIDILTDEIISPD